MKAIKWLSGKDRAIHIWQYASEHGAIKTMKVYDLRKYEYEAMMINGENYYQESAQ